MRDQVTPTEVARALRVLLRDKALIAMYGDEPEAFAVISGELAPSRAAQADGLLQHRVEHGPRSPGEELMTCSTSAVAVCCSKAFASRSGARAFSIAITACAAKFCNSPTSSSVGGRTPQRYTLSVPSRRTSLRSATVRSVRQSASCTMTRAARLPLDRHQYPNISDLDDRFRRDQNVPT